MKDYNDLIVVTVDELQYTEIKTRVDILRTSDIQDALIYLRSEMLTIDTRNNEDLFDKLIMLAMDLVSELRTKHGYLYTSWL